MAPGGKPLTSPAGLVCLLSRIFRPWHDRNQKTASVWVTMGWNGGDVRFGGAKEWEMHSTGLIDEFANDLDGYLRTRFKYKARTLFNNAKTVSANRVKFQLYLRFKPKHAWFLPNSLVIARFGFNPIRKGHGTDFLRFLVSVADNYGFEHIAIEQALSPDSQTFAERWGFSRIFDALNHTIPVSTLKAHLAAGVANCVGPGFTCGAS